jgi:hypothetical protein
MKGYNYFVKTKLITSVFITQLTNTSTKDGINNHVVSGEPTVNPEKFGTKAAVWHQFNLKAGEEKSIKIFEQCRS